MEALKICDFCNGREDGCFSMKIAFPDGGTERPIRFSLLGVDRCAGCGVLPSGYHHPGCDAEICPRCEGFLTKCGCLNKRMKS